MNTVKLTREHGLFSNINILKRLICHKIIDKENVDNIELISTLYSYENIYNKLFYIDEKYKLTKLEAQWVLDNTPCNNLGLFDNTSIDLTILKKLQKGYFNINKEVEKYYNEYKLNEPYIFIWARKIDKISENSVPEYEEYINRLNTLPKLKVIVKTDDIELYNKFIKAGYYVINMPVQNKAIHLNYNFDMNKIEYIQRLIALTLIASESKYFIGYGGNISTHVFELHNKKENCFLYKNSKELYNN